MVAARVAVVGGEMGVARVAVVGGQMVAARAVVGGGMGVLEQVGARKVLMGGVGTGGGEMEVLAQVAVGQVSVELLGEEKEEMQEVVAGAGEVVAAVHLWLEVGVAGCNISITSSGAGLPGSDRESGYQGCQDVTSKEHMGSPWVQWWERWCGRVGR
jgi:hypothetical protein